MDTDIRPNKDNDLKVLGAIKKPKDSKDNEEFSESTEAEVIEYFTE
jgi:hypothetical protein